jgi:G3E family GTPase
LGRLRVGRTAFPGTIPILVVTGFLGAGKTSVLRWLLANPGGHRLAVVVNEAASIGIDQHLLGGGDVTFLGDGCFCCRAQNDLSATLTRLFEARRDGTLPGFDRVAIETSGLADPGAVLLALAADPGLAERYHVATILTVIDASLGRETLAAQPEARMQVALADVVAVSKTDLAGADETASLQAAIAVLNPDAVMVLARDGVLDGVDVLEAAGPPRPLRHVTPVASHVPDLMRHVLVREEPWKWENFSLAMDVLGALRGPDLLRVKGVVHVLGREHPVVYHRVHHLAHKPTELEAWPEGRRATQLVFITKGLSGNDIERLADAIACL